MIWSPGGLFYIYFSTSSRATFHLCALLAKAVLQIIFFLLLPPEYFSLRDWPAGLGSFVGRSGRRKSSCLFSLGP
ncbi:hypothetical protein F5X99DRAFT_341198 [Biscogniauxia marginata]|nr:hypothetical protein F5X99DRAFT_341198 [Biscogniauxia marginata]